MPSILITFIFWFAAPTVHAAIAPGATFTSLDQPERTSLVTECEYLLNFAEFDLVEKELPPLSELVTPVIEQVRKPYGKFGTTISLVFRTGPDGDEMLIQTIEVKAGANGGEPTRIMYVISVLADGTVRYQELRPEQSLDQLQPTTWWIINGARARFIIDYGYHHLRHRSALMTMHAADYLRVELPGVLDHVWPMPPMPTKRPNLTRGFDQF